LVLYPWESSADFSPFHEEYTAFFNDGVTFKCCVVLTPLCWFDTAMLTRELRRNLNRMVTNLNARLAGTIVEEFNKVERDAVTFVLRG
jgi:hypothetical protein